MRITAPRPRATRRRCPKMPLVQWQCLAALLLVCEFALADNVNVLIVNSYHQDYQWTQEVLQGIESALANSRQKIDIHYEFMDSRQFDLAATLQPFADLLTAKYHRKLDLVIATDNDALNFVVRNKTRLFNQVPVVFVGVNNFHRAMLDGHTDIYGIKEEPDIAGTVDMMIRLHPHAGKILVVSDSSPSGGQVLTAVQAFARSSTLDVDWEFYDSWTREELGHKLSSLKPGTIVLAIALFNDRNNNYIPVTESIAWTKRHSRNPIYTMWEKYVHMGFVGGVVISGESAGHKAGGLAIAILRGETPNKQVYSSPNIPVINYLAQQHFDLKLEELSGKPQVIMEPESLYFRYKKLIWLTAGFIIFQSSIITSLFIAIHKNKHIRKQLQRRASIDPLTGLSNRDFFQIILARTMSQAKSGRDRFALIFLDLNHFKRINDNHGHQVGDKVLIEVAARLKQTFHKNGKLARLSGDEFVVIIEGVEKSSTVIDDILRQLITRMEQAIHVKNHRFYLSASIGVAYFPDDAGSASELVRHADIAMYQAKSKRKSDSAHAFYSREYSSAIHRRQTIESNLRSALQNGEFTLHYQAIVNRNRQLVGCEALLRWHNQTLGRVSPNEFIPVAEESGWIVPIGEWVLDQVCAQLQEFHRAGHMISLAVNVSYKQFQDRSILASLGKVLNQYSFAPQYLSLEITERLLVENIPDTISIIEQLKSKGLRLAIDDFGTGHSSLSYLTHYPFDKLKIDRSFVNHIGQGKHQMRVIQGIKSIADALDIEVVVEGVETEYQWRILSRLEFGEYQGYLFAIPLPVTELYKLLTTPYRDNSDSLSGAISSSATPTTDNVVNSS